MSQNIHLETLVRLFRRQIVDVSLLHLLRIGSHAYKTSYGKSFQCQSWKQKEQRSIDLLLHNFYTYEINLIWLVLWTQNHKFQARYQAPLDTKNINKKRSCISKSNSQLDLMGINQYLTRSFCIHFGRYRNRSFIALYGANFFVKKWVHYILILFRSHVNYPTEIIHIRINWLSTSCVFFLGYILTIKLVLKNVQIETTLGSYKSILSEKAIYPRIPILLLVKLLEKEKFCNSIGHPISKLAWAVLTDDNILNRFVKVWDIFSLYYSAAINKDGLRRLRYIPRLSCDSTLASKHRSTIRFLRRRFDLELPKVVHTYSNFYSLKRIQRVWHLSLIRSILLPLIPLTIQAQ